MLISTGTQHGYEGHFRWLRQEATHDQGVDETLERDCP